MKIIQAIETEYCFIRALHSSDGDYGGRLFATSIVAGQLTPVFFAFFLKYTNFAKPIQLATAFSISFIIMLVLIDTRRNNLATEYAMPSANFDRRARLFFTCFLFLSTVAIALTARISEIFSLIAYGFFAMIPLQIWVKPYNEDN